MILRAVNMQMVSIFTNNHVTKNQKKFYTNKIKFWDLNLKNLKCEIL